MKITFKQIKKLAPMFLKLLIYSKFIKTCADKNSKKYTHRYRSIVFRKELQRLNKHSFKLVFFIDGLEKSRSKQVLFAPNHQAYTDSVSMLIGSDRAIGFVTKKETKTLPTLVTNGMAAVGNIPIDRGDLRSEVIAFRDINNLLEENKDLSYVIYPEGTRSLPPEFKLGTLHPGSYRIATKLGLPIVPVCLFGDEKLLNPKYHLKKYPVQMRYLDPIYPEQYDNMTPQELAAYIQEKMETNLAEMRQLDCKYIKVLNKYSSKKMDKIKHLTLVNSIRY